MDDIPQDVLTRVVCHLLDEPNVELMAWSVEAIGYPSVSPHSRGLFRVRGRAITSGGAREWSLVLKAVQCVNPDATSAPSHPFYWKREALAYQSKLLPAQATGLAAPLCLGVTERSATSMWIWLEDIDDAASAPWDAARFARAATHIGRWSGAFGSTATLPDAPWLSRGLLRAWIADSAALIADAQDGAIWMHPLLQGTAFPAYVPAIVQLWEQRDVWCTMLEQLPFTVCHHDVWRNNLLSRGSTSQTEQTIALDWEVVGFGAVGEDIGNLVGVSLLNFDIDACDAARFASAMFDHYADGLQQAGWRGDIQVMRATAQITAALRCVFSTACWPASIVRNTDMSAQFIRESEQRWGRSIEEIFTQWSTVTAFLLAQAEEARNILQP